MKSKFFFISIITIMLVSCTMNVDMEGKGIDECEILFTNDNGEINCRDLINKYFFQNLNLYHLFFFIIFLVLTN